MKGSARTPPVQRATTSGKLKATTTLTFKLDTVALAPTLTLVNDSGAVITPACASPAPLQLAHIPARGWIVLFHAGTDASAPTAQLAAKYDFTPLLVFEHAMRAFHAELTPATVAALRCEPSVLAIEQNAQVPLP